MLVVVLFSVYSWQKEGGRGYLFISKNDMFPSKYDFVSDSRLSNEIYTKAKQCMVFYTLQCIFTICKPLKRQTKIAADDILIFLLLSYEENKA